MTVRRYIGTMIATTLIFVAAMVVLLFRVDPTAAPISGLLLFYLALFFAIWGFVSLCGIMSRFLLFRSTPVFEFIGISLRQAIWVALFVDLTLFLLSQNLFELWMAIPLALVFASIEGYFLAKTYETARQRKIAKRRPRSQMALD